MAAWPRAKAGGKRKEKCALGRPACKLGDSEGGKFQKKQKVSGCPFRLSLHVEIRFPTHTIEPLFFCNSWRNGQPQANGPVSGQLSQG